MSDPASTSAASGTAPAPAPSAGERLAGMKVLVTGGLGFIGSNLAIACLREGAAVTVYDCLDPRSGGNMHNISTVEGDVEIVVNDLRSFEGLSAAARHKDLVYNCAAYTSHPMSMRDPVTDIEVNCKGTINVLEAVRRFNPRAKIVHVGTSTQVGPMVHPVVDELHPEFPVDIYSANKTASEKYVLIYGRAYKMRTSVVRLANNFGPRSNIASAEFGFVNFFVGLALRGRNIPVFGEGGQLRNISYVEDSVEALLLAGLRPESEGQALFAVADRQCTVAQIAKAIATEIGGKVSFVEWPKDREAIEIGDAVISNARIKSRLGWAPRVSLEEGLRRTKDYFTPSLSHYL